MQEWSERFVGFDIRGREMTHRMSIAYRSCKEKARDPSRGAAPKLSYPS